MTVKELREITGLSQAKFGKYFNIPMRTIQNWEYGVCECPEYLKELMIYKLKNEKIVLDI